MADRQRIIVAAEAANAINVAIQLKDGNGQDRTERTAVMAYLSDDANGDSVAGTAPDTVAIGTDGLMMELVADKVFLLVSRPMATSTSTSAKTARTPGTPS